MGQQELANFQLEEKNLIFEQYLVFYLLKKGQSEQEKLAVKKLLLNPILI